MLLEDRLIVSGVRQRILGEGRGFVGNMLHKKQKKLHPNPQKAQANTKSPTPNPDLTPGPSPMGRGEHAS